MKNLKWLFIVVALSLLASLTYAEISSPVAEISSPVSPMPQQISINVVCLYKGFPTKANVSVAQFDNTTRSVIPGTGTPPKYAPNGFASFNVKKGLSYYVLAYKVVSSSDSSTDIKGSQIITDANSSVVIGLELTKREPTELEREFERRPARR